MSQVVEQYDPLAVDFEEFRRDPAFGGGALGRAREAGLARFRYEAATALCLCRGDALPPDFAAPRIARRVALGAIAAFSRRRSAKLELFDAGQPRPVHACTLRRFAALTRHGDVDRHAGKVARRADEAP